MTDIKPSAVVHRLRPVAVPSLGLADAEAEARCRAVLRLVEARPEVIRTVDDLLAAAEYIELGVDDGTDDA